MNVACSKSWRPTLHQEATDAILCMRPDYGYICYTSVGDPHFGPIQYVRVTITTRTGSHAPRVTAKIWLCQPEASNHFTSCHLRQPLLLLLLCTKLEDREHDKRTLN